MSTKKSMRWNTAVDIVSEGIEALIYRKTEEATQARNVLYLLKRLPAPGASVREAPPAEPVGDPPAPGTIPDRILEVVTAHGGPITRAAIFDALDTTPAHGLQKGLSQLCREGRLLATGNTTKRRFSLPVTSKKGRK